MAVDTKDRRLSMLNFGEGDALLPDSDGSFDADDMAHLLGLYSGISLVPTGGEPAGILRRSAVSHDVIRTAARSAETYPRRLSQDQTQLRRP